MELVGRYAEIEQCQNLLKTTKSEFLAVYGRRRVGKTFLLRNVFSQQIIFHHTAESNSSNTLQLDGFFTTCKKYLGNARLPNQPENWREAFNILKLIITKSRKTKKVVFIDELPWMDTIKSGFLSALEHFWNAWASQRKDIVLVICGSSASWIINKIINNKGGLHNRITSMMKIEPFNLKECFEYFKAKKATYSQIQILELYMCIGGIPYYLDYIDIKKSIIQNINKLFFTPNGQLRLEYNKLYHSIFKNAEQHLKIIDTLAKKNMGMSRLELIKKSKLANAGSTTRFLQELEECGFIAKHLSFEKKERQHIYQLTDHYTLFYHRFIAKSSIKDKDFWIKLNNTPSYNAWSGIAFEQVCHTHIFAIHKALGIDGMLTYSSSWMGKGAQIDMLIDRNDKIITVCEMKFSSSNYNITSNNIKEWQEKMETFRLLSKTKKTIKLCLVTTHGANNLMNFDSYISKQVTIKDLFVNK